MSASLERAWHQRTGDRITLDDYFAGGGVHGALEAMAEEAFDGLSSSQQNAARRILLRLSAHVNGTWVRRPALAQELAPTTDDDASRALDQLLTWRLVTAGPLTVELTHEALLTRWPRLQIWLAERAAVADQLEFLGTAALTWDHDARPDEGLLRGPRLQGASQWEAAHPDEFTPIEVEFLRSSRLAIDRELRIERGRRRRLSVITAVVAVLAVGAALLTGVAIRERNTASTSARRAVAGKLTAESSTVNDTQLSILLAAAALRLGDTSDSRAALLTALVRPGGALWTAKTSDKLEWVGTSSNARVAWAADDQYNMWRIDTVRHTAKRVFGVPGGSVADLSPDGRYLVTCGWVNSGLRQTNVVKTDNGLIVRTLTSNPSIAAQPKCGQFTRDGRWYLEESISDSVANPYLQLADQLLIYDASHWSAPPRRVKTGGELAGLATSFSTAVVWRTDGSLAILDPASGDLGAFTRRSDLTGCTPNGGCQIAISPDGKWLAYTTASNTHTPKLLSTSMLGAVSADTPGLAAPITRLGFSPDSSQLALTAVDGSVMVVDANRKATTVFNHAGGGTGEFGLAWTRAGSHMGLLTVGHSSELTSWDLTSIPAIVRAGTRRISGDNHGNFANGYYIDRASRVDPKTGNTATVSIYRDDLATGQRISIHVPIQPALGEDVQWFWPSTDGSSATVTVQDTWLQWRVYVANFERRSLTLVYSPKSQDALAHSNSAALSIDGRSVYVAAGLQKIRTVDVASGRVTRTVTVPFGVKGEWPMEILPIGSDRFGKVVAWEQEFDPTFTTATEGLTQPIYARDPRRTLLLIDPTTGKIDGQVQELGLPGALAWSQDGSRLAVAADDGGLAVFDARTLRPVAPRVTETSAMPITVSWSPDGSMLATSRTDGQVLLWDAATLQQLGPGAVLGHNGPVFAFYAQNGNITGFMPSTIDDPLPSRWFSLPGTPSRWLAAACSAVGRDLTAAEWSRYVGDIRQIRVCPNAADH
jgi:WD40 repeat protein